MQFLLILNIPPQILLLYQILYLLLNRLYKSPENP